MKNTFLKKVVKSGLCMMLLVALLVALIPMKSVEAAEEPIGTGTLDANWVNLGLNWNMTGGTSGKVKKGETFIVYEQKVVKNKVRYYVYAEKAGIYGYISEKYIDFTPYEDDIYGYGTLNANWVNLGVNWNMTGGTSGKVVRGETFIVYEQKVVNNKVRYYVYAENAGIFGYIAEKYINVTPVETEEIVTDESEQEAVVKDNEKELRRKVAEVALNEFNLYGNQYIGDKVKYNYYWITKKGMSSSPWCADFVNWCTHQAGVPMSVVPYEIDGNTSSETSDGYSNYGRYYQEFSLAYVPHLVEYLTEDYGAKYYDVNSKEIQNGSYVPQPGDFIIYRTEKSTSVHVGLVVDFNAETGKVTTVEGNTTYGDYSDGCIAKKVRTYNKAYAGTNWYIQGYLVPAYGME